MRNAILGLVLGVGATTAAWGQDVTPSGERSVFWDLHCAANVDPKPVEANHPYLAGGFVAVPWNMIEPVPSGPESPFDFSRVETHVALWAAAGKRSVLRTNVLGKNCVADWPFWFPRWMLPESAPWPSAVEGVYACSDGEEDCVDTVAFLAKDADTEVTLMPRIWDSPEFLSVYEDYVAGLAAAYDGDPRIAHVWIGVGHGGYTTVNTSGGGAETLSETGEAGWTPALWKQYVIDVIDIYSRHFAQTPLLLAVSPKWTRSIKHDAIVSDLQDLTLYAVQSGASLFLNGLATDPLEYDLSPFAEVLDHLASEPLPDDFSLIMGDDWPMWIDEERRISQPFLSDRDANGFRCLLQTAELAWDLIDRRGALVIKVLRDEIEVTNPLTPTDFRPEVAEVFDEFALGTAEDCNNNGISDLCEGSVECDATVDGGSIPETTEDGNDDGVLDECEVPPLDPDGADCDGNREPTVDEDDVTPGLDQLEMCGVGTVGSSMLMLTFLSLVRVRRSVRRRA